MELTDREVRRVAELARLGLDDHEVEGLRQDMSKILGYVAKLDELDTTGVEPTSHVADVSVAVRPDVVTNESMPEDAVAESTNSQGNYFAVPSIIE
jgi:aspartyl-tRNA(Asn)/glutamyl-tRNA(Gln) amidotransferase subunit C